MPEDVMPWTPVRCKDAVLAFWPGVSVEESDIDGILAGFKNEFGFTPLPVGCVETLPDIDRDGNAVEGTGGRHDFFFFVGMEYVPAFATMRFKCGARWWQDVYSNDQEHMYPAEFLAAFPSA